MGHGEAGRASPWPLFFALPRLSQVTGGLLQVGVRLNRHARLDGGVA